MSMSFFRDLKVDKQAAVEKALAANPALANIVHPVSGQRPLHIAVLSANDSTIGTLLKAGANPDHRDRTNNLPLHLACSTGRVLAVRQLIAAGDRAQLKSRNSAGQMPLHTAVVSGRAEVVQVLVAAGASPNMKDHSGKTALDLAKNQPHVLEALEQGRSHRSSQHRGAAPASSDVVSLQPYPAHSQSRVFNKFSNPAYNDAEAPATAPVGIGQPVATLASTSPAVLEGKDSSWTNRLTFLSRVVSTNKAQKVARHIGQTPGKPASYTHTPTPSASHIQDTDPHAPQVPAPHVRRSRRVSSSQYDSPVPSSDNFGPSKRAVSTTGGRSGSTRASTDTVSQASPILLQPSSSKHTDTPSTHISASRTQEYREPSRDPESSPANFASPEAASRSSHAERNRHSAGTPSDAPPLSMRPSTSSSQQSHYHPQTEPSHRRAASMARSSKSATTYQQDGRPGAKVRSSSNWKGPVHPMESQTMPKGRQVNTWNGSAAYQSDAPISGSRARSASTSDVTVYTLEPHTPVIKATARGFAANTVDSQSPGVRGRVAAQSSQQMARAPSPSIAARARQATSAFAQATYPVHSPGSQARSSMTTPPQSLKADKVEVMTTPTKAADAVDGHSTGLLSGVSEMSSIVTHTMQHPSSVLGQEKTDVLSPVSERSPVAHMVPNPLATLLGKSQDESLKMNRSDAVSVDALSSRVDDAMAQIKQVKEVEAKHYKDWNRGSLATTEIHTSLHFQIEQNGKSMQALRKRVKDSDELQTGFSAALQTLRTDLDLLTAKVARQNSDSEKGSMEKLTSRAQRGFFVDTVKDLEETVRTLEAKITDLESRQDTAKAGLDESLLLQNSQLTSSADTDQLHDDLQTTKQALKTAVDSYASQIDALKLETQQRISQLTELQEELQIQVQTISARLLDSAPGHDSVAKLQDANAALAEKVAASGADKLANARMQEMAHIQIMSLSRSVQRLEDQIGGSEAKLGKRTTNAESEISGLGSVAVATIDDVAKLESSLLILKHQFSELKGLTQENGLDVASLKAMSIPPNGYSRATTSRRTHTLLGDHPYDAMSGSNGNGTNSPPLRCPSTPRGIPQIVDQEIHGSAAGARGSELDSAHSQLGAHDDAVLDLRMEVRAELGLYSQSVDGLSAAVAELRDHLNTELLNERDKAAEAMEHTVGLLEIDLKQEIQTRTMEVIEPIKEEMNIMRDATWKLQVDIIEMKNQQNSIEIKTQGNTLPTLMNGGTPERGCQGNSNVKSHVRGRSHADLDRAQGPKDRSSSRGKEDILRRSTSEVELERQTWEEKTDIKLHVLENSERELQALREQVLRQQEILETYKVQPATIAIGAHSQAMANLRQIIRDQESVIGHLQNSLELTNDRVSKLEDDRDAEMSTQCNINARMQEMLDSLCEKLGHW